MRTLQVIGLGIGLLLITLSGCEKDPLIRTNDCPQTSSKTHPKGAKLQQLLEQHVDKGLPGAILLIRDSSGRWVGSAGQADLKEDIPMRPCHVSKVASITKLMMGTLAFQLIEQGKLQLSDQIAQYLPEKVIEKVDNAETATVRQLLNHSSGIYDVVSDQGFYLEVLNQPHQQWTQEKLLKYVSEKPAAFAPGQDAGYSNTNYLLLSMILDKVAEDSHVELLRQNILNPLSMDDTYYDWHDELPDNTVQGYNDLYNNGTILKLTNYSTGNGNGYTGVFSTVFDLQRFIEALLRGKTLLRDSTLQTMLTFSDEIVGGKRFGLGIYKDFVERKRSDEYGYGHRGRDLAYSADLNWFPNQDVTMVLLVNYGTNAESQLQTVYFDLREKIVDQLM